jgi:glycosyltransferase involved in cell wall biosynthesis
VRIVVITPLLNARGGMELAATRLATVLQESGHDVSLLYGQGVSHAEIRSECFPVLVEQIAPPEDELGTLRAYLRKEARDLHICVGGASWLLACAAAVGPTLWSMQGLTPICPDGSKYWSRISRPCAVRGGAKCRLIRPLLGCTDLATAVRQEPIRRLRSFERLFDHDSVGFLAPSSDMRIRLLDQGVPNDRVAVLPNLGVLATADELARSAAAWPQDDRDAVLFLGRFSETKGAHLLPRINRCISAPGARLVAYGWGYLADRLQAAMPGQIREPVTQQAMVGGLLWARGVVAPGLWPEPGGLVAVDAQLAGNPLGAFAVGAAHDWSGADLHPVGDVTALARWIDGLEPVEASREPSVVAASQSRYWSSVGALAQRLTTEFVQFGRWEEPSSDSFSRFLAESSAG